MFVLGKMVPRFWEISMRIGFGIAAILAVLAASPAMAQSIHTGSQGGAYNSTFCPPLPSVLNQAFFSGYRCMASGGTLDNIAKVLAKPSDVGFVQLDVFALQVQEKPELAKQISIIRSDIACEGMWMVTKNPALKSYGDVLGFSRRIPFVLPGQGSGSSASFKYLQTIDPDGLGRATNVKYVNDTASVINTVAAGADNAVGFFVQFADPENTNIRLMQEKGLTVVPVVSRQITQAKVKDQELYQVQSFNLKAGGIFTSSEDKVTACTPVAVITGNPEAQTDKNQKDNQKDLIEALAKVPSSSLLPTEPRMAKLLSNVRRVSGAALNEMVAATDKFKDAAQKAMQ
jgi:hypothetical protein